MLATTIFIFVTVCNLNGLDTRGQVNAAQFEAEDVPESCKDKTYCTEKPKDYPEEVFDNMFKGSTPIFQPTLVLDSLPANRRHGEPEAKDDCESNVTYEPLYQVRTKPGDQWRTVVQAPNENYVQKVRLETCTNPNNSCFKAIPLTPDITTLCVQKYNKWEVLVAKGEKETEKLEVELPVCCSCQYKTPPIET